MNNNIIEAETYGDVFIIPNRYHDGTAQIWITNNENDNMVDHGFYITANDGNEYYIPAGELPRRVNKEILPSSEGISKFVEFDVHPLNDGFRKDKTVTIKLLIALTANQLEYRYRNFGKFEDVLAAV